MPEETYDSKSVPKRRPLFLTILCVLTFIGSVAGIVTNMQGYIHAQGEVHDISSGKTKTQLRHLFSGDVTANTQPVKISNLNEDNYRKYSIGCIIACLLCLVGTVLMFRLKRTGFYSFTLGTFFNLITHFLLFGDNFGSMGLSILAALSGFIFVILFALNLKWMDEA